jgi:hypothetical protein
VNLDELRPEWRDDGRTLVFDCPCGPPRCGGRIRVPPGWAVTGVLPLVSVAPSLHVEGHVHFTVTNGGLTFAPGAP